MGDSSKTVAVIGCGVSGLAAVKCCLDEGLQPTCFERSDDLGGLWNYRENSKHEVTTSVYRSTTTNTSKESMSFSDFLFPDEWPNFLHNSYMKRYLDMYADKFGLKKHIHFSTRVTRLAQAPDYESTGRWVVTTQAEGAARQTSQEFDTVMICTGMLNNPNIPEFPGLEGFQGKVIHSQAFRRPEEFEGKRVVVVGIGNSGADAATDISRLASQVYLSTERGAWITSRIGDYGMPWDLDFFRRFFRVPAKLHLILHTESIKRQFEMFYNSLMPAHGLTAREPLITEDLPGCILNGTVIIKANIARFTKTGMVFGDGTTEEDIDAVIMATGYKDTLPFKVDCPALEMKDGRLPLYKLVFPLGMQHNTLSVNGAIKPFGAFIPCVELQARWAPRVFKGLAELPSQPDMEAEVKATDEAMKEAFLPSHRYINPVAYCINVASEIGVEPNFLKLFFTDPVLTLRCLFGPHVPYQYRLEGPGKNDGARKAINTVWERVLKPTKTRPIGPKEDARQHVIILGFCISVLVVVTAWLLL
ncbi:flavin-containing monooxygenase 5-like [Patiria miniata]|uniref:Flavin-containing monooxygenase n=1 Tax=Patiria miniata TaxID=46514 RepID=A0A913Z679_PATMI|nr:flavin-containing monooxygenase 5-like [Patiria miniata]XP_038047321.1 flavin-containing monooxygenase 5-like [Patiria miniata]